MITVIIPVAPWHLATAEQAIASCAAQSFPVHVIPVIDHEQRGTGWTRNQGLAQVDTPFVTFLDADDVLDPAFAEHMLRAYDGAHYVYSDWWQDSDHIRAPERPWVNQTWHVVTALVPTAWARFVGGFDETLRGGEDTEFFVKLRHHGMCGKRLAEPLMHYRRGGRRSHEFFDSPEYHAFQTLLTDRYGGQPMAACCGEYVPDEQPPVNARQDGDVLAIALWGGNRQQRGAVSNRLYPRAGNGARMWVYASDVERSPHLWQQVVDTPKPPTAAQMNEFQVFAAQVLGGGTVVAPNPAPVAPRINPLDAPVKPDVFRLRALYKAATNG